MPDRKALDDIIFDAPGLTRIERITRQRGDWGVAELVKQCLDKAAHTISWACTAGTTKLINAVACKHFRSMNIDYRPIFPDFAEWWKPEESNTV